MQGRRMSDSVIVQNVQGPSGASSIAVSGTGFLHATGGGLDAAARAVNLASADVTGTLPIANGGTNLASVGLNGNVLQVIAGVLAYAAVNLAGGANAVTGVLPTANQADRK